MAIQRSLSLFKQAKTVMAGGVNSPVRSFVSVGGNPLVMERGKGPNFFDVDGNRYTDYCLSWGALILGHGHREVRKAVARALRNGTSFGTTTRIEIEMAKFIVRNVPSIEMVRFVNSGTEAAMSAVRLARGFTGKKAVVKFDGGYHGHFEDFLIKAGSGVAKLQESSSLGIPAEHLQNTISLPYNDIVLLSETLNRFHGNIACVIIEPVAGNMGVIPAHQEFLKALRELTQKHNIVLIFDEIMSGLRTSLGCVQMDLGIIPDLTCLGKIIGGGFPIGAYGGRKDIMKNLAPLGGVYQAGTFSGNPVVLAAGLATLKNLSKDLYARLNAQAEDFAGTVNGCFEEQGLPARLSAYKSMLSIRFRRQPVSNYTDAKDASSDSKYEALFRDLLKSGIYWPPADLEAFFISALHTPGDLVKLAGQLKRFFTVQKGGQCK